MDKGKLRGKGYRQVLQQSEDSASSPLTTAARVCSSTRALWSAPGCATSRKARGSLSTLRKTAAPARSQAFERSIRRQQVILTHVLCRGKMRAFGYGDCSSAVALFTATNPLHERLQEFSSSSGRAPRVPLASVPCCRQVGCLWKGVSSLRRFPRWNRILLSDRLHRWGVHIRPIRVGAKGEGLSKPVFLGCGDQPPSPSPLAVFWVDVWDRPSLTV